MDVVKQAFERVRLQAMKDGAEVEMLVTGGDRLSLKFQQKKLKTFNSSQSQMAGIRVLFRNQQGYAYTEKIEEEALLRAYLDALENAKIVQKPVTVEIQLVKPSSFRQMPELCLHEDIPLEKKMEVAALTESGCLDRDKRIDSVPYGSYSESKGFKRILNSNGMDQTYESGAYVSSAHPLAKDGNSSKSTGRSTIARRFADLNVDQMTIQAVADTLSLLNADKLPTGHYPVVIRSDQAQTLLAMISSYFSAKSVDEKKSLYRDKMNQKVASSLWTLTDDPLNTNGMAARPFDDEGSPSQKTVLIENGILKNFITNSEYSKKLNLPLTAHASRTPSSEMGIETSNLYVSLGSKNRQELLSKYPTTVFITHFAAGLHASFNSTTGDISMPCEGILYENGRPVKAVEQFILSMNIMDLMLQTEETGDSYMDPSSGMNCPDILITSVSLAGDKAK